MPKSGGNSIVCFGLFEADLRSGELRRNGQKVRLQEQPFQVLALLLQKPSEVVTREELRAKLWPADTFVDFDHGLNAAIKRLRDALGDSAENPRFVETLARRGYRFIAPVETSLEDRPKTSLAKKYWLTSAVVAAVLSAGVIMGWVAGRKSVAALNPKDRRLTGNPQNDPIWSAAVSPDGKYLAFADKAGFFLRVLNSGETHALMDPDNLQTHRVAWFPDGTHLLAARRELPDGKLGLWSVSVLGGAARKLIDDGDQGAVSPDGTRIAFVSGDYNRQELWVMGADGEHPKKLVARDGGDYGSVSWAPDGKHIAFLHYVYSPPLGGEVSIEVCDPGTERADTVRNESRSSVVVLSDSRLWNGLAWTSDGRLIYSLSEPPPNRTDSNLWAQKIDPLTFRPIGSPVRLTSGPDGKARLSLSADGKRLSYLRLTYSPHVYVSKVGQEHGHLGPLQRLSLDERGNYPYDWTPDGKSVIFTSDRDGAFHVFKQGLEQPAPELLVGGENNVLVTRLDFPGTAILYLLSAPANDPSGRMRMMRMPITGGVPQLVLAEPSINNFQCARRHSNVCVLTQYSTERLTFYTFDSVTGKESFLKLVQDPEWSLFNWSLSPDGTTLALAKKHRATPSEIRIFRMDGTGERELGLENWFAIDYLDWAADGQSLWVNAMSPAGTATLLNVAVNGKITPSLEETEMTLGWAIPSPDGRRVALWRGEQSSNVWLLEGF